VFFCDDGQGVPACALEVAEFQPAQPEKLPAPHQVEKRPPALLPDRFIPTFKDFPPNNKACDCSKCGRRILKGQGYKQFSLNGFWCEICQYDADQPTRPERARVSENANA
jgi:hypothetical protein